MTTHELASLEELLRDRKDEILVVQKSGKSEQIYTGACTWQNLECDEICSLYYLIPTGKAKKQKNGIVIPTKRFVYLEFISNLGTDHLDCAHVVSAKLEMPLDFYSREGKNYKKGGFVFDKDIQTYFMHMAMQSNTQVAEKYFEKSYYAMMKSHGYAERFKKTLYDKCKELLDTTPKDKTIMHLKID